MTQTVRSESTARTHLANKARGQDSSGFTAPPNAQTAEATLIVRQRSHSPSSSSKSLVPALGAMQRSTTALCPGEPLYVQDSDPLSNSNRLDFITRCYDCMGLSLGAVKGCSVHPTRWVPPDTPVPPYIFLKSPSPTQPLSTNKRVYASLQLKGCVGARQRAHSARVMSVTISDTQQSLPAVQSWSKR